MEKKLFCFAHILGLPACALRFADGGGGTGADNGGAGGENAEDNNGGTSTGKGQGDSGGEENADDKQFTQADIDAAVEKRLARERKKWDREHPAQPSPTQTQTPPPAAGANDGTQQQTQQPKDDSAAKIAKANQRIVATEAKAVALASGVKPDKVAYVVKLAELGGIDVDEDDGPDTDAIKKAVEKVLKDMPEFKAAPDDGKGGSGFQIGADGSNQGASKQTQQPQGAAQPTSVKRWNRFR